MRRRKRSAYYIGPRRAILMVWVFFSFRVHGHTVPLCRNEISETQLQTSVNCSDWLEPWQLASDPQG